MLDLRLGNGLLSHLLPQDALDWDDGRPSAEIAMEGPPTRHCVHANTASRSPLDLIPGPVVGRPCRQLPSATGVRHDPPAEGGH